MLIQPRTSYGESDYRVGSEDVLKVSVYDEPDLSLEVRVSSDGIITYPLLGRVKVGGLTIPEVEKALLDLLGKDYLVNPQVTVFVQEYGTIYVIGEVHTPGPYPLKPHMSLMSALAMAGGITDLAALDKVIVIRKEGDSKQVIEVSVDEMTNGGLKGKDIVLRPYDVIQVKKSSGKNIYILGQVTKPGEYELKESLTVVEAISLAGGLTKISAPNRTRVIRVEDGKKTVIKVPVNSILKSGNKKEDVTLQADDVVMVPESFF